MGRLRELLRSRTLGLAVSIVLLTMSVLFAADFMDLRGANSSEREVRSTIAESLAVQLSTLASVSDTAAIKFSVANFVKRSEGVLAAALVTARGETLAEYGDLAEFGDTEASSSAGLVRVPIMQGPQRWGEVRVVFDTSRNMLSELAYFGFVLVGSFVAFLLFLRKALAQLDPSQVVPGRVNSAFNLLSEGVVILDDQLRIVLANESVGIALDKPVKDLIGQSLDDWDWDGGDELQAPWTTALHSGLNVSNQAMHLRTDDERTHIFMVSCAAVGNEEDGMRGVMVTLDDMTAIEHKNHELATTLRQLRRSQESIARKNKELEALATQDPLTGLANRRSLLAFLDRAYAEACRESAPLSCVMVDIDHFKRINDTHGHGAGDEIICAVANVLAAGCRDQDIVGRYGGEEFVIVLPELDETDATVVAERLRLAIENLARDIMVPVDELSASFGVAALGADTRDMMDILECADQALYAAKQSGRNRVLAYDPKVTKLAAPAQPEQPAEEDAAGSTARLVELEAMVKERNRDLEMLREHHALTGIPKRALFLQRVETEIQRAHRFNTKVGVLSVEIKDLGRIVATFGHAAADALVVDVIAQLEDSLRQTDVVAEITEHHSISHITSNEYGALLTDLDRETHAMPVITRLRRGLAKPFVVDGQKVYVGANIGVALLSPDADSAVELLSGAGVARSKAALDPDKISHSFSSSALDKASREYVALETDLYDAFENGQFQVHYQPQIDLAERKVVGMEALLRWAHPEHGFVPPLEFISIAEANGMIHDLSKFVLTECIGQLQRWRAMGWEDLQMSLNISPLQLRETSIVNDILLAIDQAGVPRDRIEVELTEGTLIDSPQRARIVLGQLRDAGVSVAMDDFGTGYSSLALLADLPLDTVKIDRSFVIGMEDNARSRAIVESVINMAHALRLRVVAEGVETNEVLAMLTGLGCHQAQGFLISRPAAADDILAFLTTQQRLSAGESR